MRKIILSILLLISTLGIAQSKKHIPNLPAFDEDPLHFGFSLGFNVMDFNVIHSNVVTEGGKVAYYADVAEINTGINIGIVSSLKLRKKLNLRFLPGISFGQRNLWFVDENGVLDEEPKQVKSTFLEFPLLLKYGASRIRNYKPYVVAGIAPRIDLAKSKKDGLLLNSIDLYWELGVGFDSYLSYFRLSTELKMCIGLRNVLNPKGTDDPNDIIYTKAIDRLTSRIVSLNFYFE